MDIHMTRRRLAGVASTTAFLMAIAVPASAHIEIIDGGAVEGGGHGTQITLRVPHGCEGVATDTLEVKIPDGVTGVKPKLMPGWTIETEADAAPQDSAAPQGSGAPGASPAAEEEPETGQVTLVRWTGGSLPDSQYADFQLMADFPETPGTVTFPVVQRCGDTEIAWIEVPAEGQTEDDLELPAPTVTIVAAGGETTDH